MSAPRWTLVGSVGGPGFGAVDPRGRLTAQGHGWTLDWRIGADDRWHVPSDEPAVRQRRSGPGVVETLVKVPGGDAVERIFGVGGPGDLVVVDVENASPLPFAVAFVAVPPAGRSAHEPPVFVPRSPFDVDVPEVPGGATTYAFPVAHRASVRVAVALAGGVPAAVDVAGLASVDEVRRGWEAHLARAMRGDLPDEGWQRALDAARASLLLFDDGVEPRPAPWTGGRPPDAVAQVTALERWGFDRHASELRRAVPRRHRRRHRPSVLGPGEARLRVDAMVGEASPTYAWKSGGEGHHGGRTAEFLLAMRDLLVAERSAGVAVVPAWPPAWGRGGLEVHHAPVGGALVSFAVRWHGERPALIWEAEGGPVRLTAPGLEPGWSTTEPRGEALLAGARAGITS